MHNPKENFVKIGAGTNVLEIGCGDGGNLLPFAKLGCSVVGCDIADMRINDARKFFSEEHVEAKFIACDAFLLKDLENQFDIILCHDVIEHIYDKIGFMTKCKKLLKSNGELYLCLFLHGKCHLEVINKFAKDFCSVIYLLCIFYQILSIKGY